MVCLWRYLDTRSCNKFSGGALAQCRKYLVLELIAFEEKSDFGIKLALGAMGIVVLGKIASIGESQEWCIW